MLCARFLRQLRYTKDHEWVKLADGIGTVGISKFAQKELGEVVFVEVKPVKSKINKSEVLGAVESVKAASDVYSPLSGTIIEINEKLSDSPNLINDSAEEHGWLAKIKVDNSDVSHLMDSDTYSKFCKK
eukprot:NODE_100_length_20331_cov_1.214462.p20 type:complete len:129 gc:universal NODE_100_length_20331_cov_1.214462:3423-3809(+)